jgi:signal transduction histidine kinase
MQISTKLTLALSLSGLALFSGYAVHLVRAETRDLRTATEGEVRLLGRTLQVAVENALRDRQLTDIRETLDRLETVEPNVEILVFDLDGRPSAVSEGSAAIARPAQFGTETVLSWVPPEDSERIELVMPLMADNGARLGTLLVVRPTPDMKQDLEATRRGIAFSVITFVAVTWILGLLLGRLLITKPLGRLASAMERVRSGDLSSAISGSPHDEVGALAAQFNAMVAELRETRLRLERESESKRQLQSALESADKLVTVGQLSAGLAHEIGSPLQILHGRASALLARAHDPEQTKRNAEILVTQCERITRIVQQLLKFARRSTPKITPIDLAATVRAVTDLLEIEARRHGLGLALVASDVPSLVADSDRIQQVVLNLLTNAFAATPRGGSVTVRVERGTLRGADEAPIPSVRLTVEDTGSGVPTELRDRLFEPFFTTRDAAGGTGLGLAVVKAIVNEHEGTITVASEPGKGTIFTVDLPATPAHE